MKTKIYDALRLAFPRFVSGALGMWCVVGPIVLLNASETANWGLTALLVLLLLLCYAVVLVNCLRAKWDILKELVSETTLTLCFMMVGLLINEVTGIFVTVKHKLVIVYALVGFFIAELIKSQGLIKELALFRRKQTVSSNQPVTEAESSNDDLPMDSVIQKGALAKEVAEFSCRLTENQRPLAANEKEQSRLVSLETHNRHLEEMINSLRSQLKQSTVRIQAAVDVSANLQNEVAALKQQIAQREAAITTFQSGARSAPEIQFENQQIRLENQRLQEELENHRGRLNASATRLQELAGQNQAVFDRCQRLEAEVTDLKRQLRDSQSRDRDFAAARQQLAVVEAREMFYREQQQRLEARIVDLELELSKRNTRAKLLDDTRKRLRETERVCQELAENNRRLCQAVSVWQEGLIAGDHSRRQGVRLWQQIGQLQTEQVRLIDENRPALREIAAGGKPIGVASPVADFNPPKVIQPRTNAVVESLFDEGALSATEAYKRTTCEIASSVKELPNHGSQETAGDLSSRDLIAVTHREKPEEADWVSSPSLKRQWRFGAAAAGVVVIAGAVAMGVLDAKFSASKAVAVAPETNSRQSTVEAVSSRPIRPAPRLRGTFETVRPTQVYSGPSEYSAFIADIGAGMKLNVVDSSYGWLEIRSRHGRPPGFVRQEAAVRIARN